MRQCGIRTLCLGGTFSRLHQARLSGENTHRMARITVTFSISLPPEMAVELEEIMKEEHRTRSELVREALRRYFAFFHNRRASPQGD